MNGNGSFRYSGTELEAMGCAGNYHRWIVSEFAPYLGPRVVEVGAGIGNFSDHLLRSGAVKELVAIEPAENLFPLLQQRFAQDARVRPLRGDLTELAGTLSVDSVVLVNVLEHVDDDAGLLRTIASILSAGGTLLLFVPAMPKLYGSLDKAFEHHRRYARGELDGKLQAAGFRIERLRYFNLPGVVAWFVAGKVLKQTTVRPAQVWLYDRMVVPWVSLLEKVWQPPFGQSLLAVARK